MTRHAVQFEETRLEGIEEVSDYTAVHERHRVFPAVFQGRRHRRILDVAAGVGCIAERIRDHYPAAELICNDISPTSLKVLRGMGLNTVSFDIDDDDMPFPFEDGRFDAVIATVTIEHVYSVDHFLREINRILEPNGYLYLSAPNYTGLLYLPRFILKGRTFHDPVSGPYNAYEFYAHVRYYTYNTLLEFVPRFGFTPESVYLAVPQDSTRYRAMYQRSKAKALGYRYAMKSVYTLLPPRWAAEPIICFKKTEVGQVRKPRKVVL